jgi:hypothetical protein
VPKLEATLENTVVRPIFESVRVNGNRDQSLPAVVLDNRKDRAYKRVLDALVSRGAPDLPRDLRGRLESIVEAWSAQSFHDAFQPIEEFEIRCARERDRVIAEQSGDPRRVLEVLESEFRRKVSERYGSIELRGIQLNHRVILDLDQVYIPLHFEEMTEPRKDKEGRLVLPRRMALDEILKSSPRILLIGSPGSGKSTLISLLASRCARGEAWAGLPDGALPFVLPVRELKDVATTPAWLAIQLEVSPEVVSSALSEGRAVLLVDGLDEASADLRQQIISTVAELTQQYPKLPAIVTSRPAGAPGETESCLPGFQGFRLADLAENEVNEFIDKWCSAAERSARPDSTEAEREANLAARDLKSRIARSKPVQRIAANPLLTTIICVVHRFLGRTIPEHRVTLYEKCTDALLYEWDRAKFSENAAVGNLDANQKRTLLRGIASGLHEKHEAEMTEQEVVQHFASVLPLMGKPQEDALRIVREIRDRTGLLVERRPGFFGFSHLTFQEYFTALDYTSRSEELLGRLEDPWWHEVIALAAGISGCDPIPLIQALLSKNSREATILAAKCMETAASIPPDLRNKVEECLMPYLDDTRDLLEIGLTAAPLVLRNLSMYRGAQRMMHPLAFLGTFNYEPAIPVLIRLASDQESLGFDVPIQQKIYSFTLGDWCIYILAFMAINSETARRALVSVLPLRQSDDLVEFLKSQNLLPDDVKLSPLDKTSSTPAKSIASKRRNKPALRH